MSAEQPFYPPQPRTWRHAVAYALHQFGVMAAIRSFSRRYEIEPHGWRKGRPRRWHHAKYIVLGYHGVGEHRVPLYCHLPTEIFADQMRHLKQHYRIVSLQQMVEELDRGHDCEPGVVVTFDDGYLSTYTDAFPVLKELDIPATVYLLAGAIEKNEVPWYDRIFLQMQYAPSTLALDLSGMQKFEFKDRAGRVEAGTQVITHLRRIPDMNRKAWCKSFDELVPLPSKEEQGAMMSWDQILEMSSAGISFGAHTMTHPVTSRLTADAFAYEVKQSKMIIESRIGKPIYDFAFPFGKAVDCFADATEILQAAGYRTAMTTLVGVNRAETGRFRLRRMVIGEERSIAMFALQLQRLMIQPIDEDAAELPLAAAEV